MRFDGGRAQRRRLSLTPLIDVVFLLLVFFMLASRLGAEHPLALELASAQPVTGSAVASNEADVLRVRVGPRGEHDALRQIAALDGVDGLAAVAAVEIEAHVDTPLQAVLDVLETLRAAGATHARIADTTWAAGE